MQELGSKHDERGVAMDMELDEIEDLEKTVVKEEDAEKQEDRGLIERGKALLCRNKGKVMLAAAGLAALGIAWKCGYIEDALDAAKIALSKVESSGQSRESIHVVESISRPANSNSQPRAYTAPRSPFEVSSHIRNLPAGRTNSAENRALAAKYGVSLLPNQSYIPTYEKCRAAA